MQIVSSISLTDVSEDGGPPFLELGADIIALEWLPEHEALAVASSHGDLLLVHKYPESEVEAVGMLEGGVAGIAWGPDGEIVAIATGAGKLLLMTKVRKSPWFSRGSALADMRPEKEIGLCSVW